MELKNNIPNTVKFSAEDRVQDGKTRLKHATSILSETETIGADTLNQLAVQGEKLDNLNGKLNDINQNQYHANRHLNVISSITGYITNYFSREPKHNKTLSTPTPDKNSSRIQTKEVQTQIQKETAPFYDQETEDILAELSGSLGRIKNMSIEMGNEIQRQNSTIDQLNNRVDITNDKMKKINTRIAKI